MRYETKTFPVGECLGPIDWGYDFTQHDWSGTRGGINPEVSKDRVAVLRQLAETPEKYLATTDGGSPKVGYKQVLQVGMYDGWPFWKPTPSVMLAGTLGPEWHPWYSITAIDSVVSASGELHCGE